MKRVKLLHITPKKKLIGLCSTMPKINSFVYLKENNRKIGKIYDIFGPANKPYLKIIPLNNISNEVINKEAYIKEVKSQNQRNRRNPKRTNRKK